MRDHKVPGWLAVLGDASAPVFGFIMGMATGAVGAVLAAPLAPTSESLKVFLSVASAGLGAAGGALVGVFLERRKDNIARRRKTKRAMQRVVRICMQITAVLGQMENLNHLHEREILLPRGDDDPVARSILLFGILLEQLIELGAHPPNFDDILESDDDIGTASHIEELFRAMTRLPLAKRPDGAPFPPLGDSAVTLATLRRVAGMNQMIETRAALEECRNHFEGKVLYADKR